MTMEGSNSGRMTMEGSIHDFMMKMARALVDGAPSLVARLPYLDDAALQRMQYEMNQAPREFAAYRTPAAPDAAKGGEAPQPADPITEVNYLPSRTHDQDEPGPLWVEWSQPNDPRSWDLASHDAYLRRQREVDLYHQSITEPLSEWEDLRRRAEPLSASWHHLPCVTTGLPDPRPVHPVAAAIGRQGKAAAPGLVMPRGFE